MFQRVKYLWRVFIAYFLPTKSHLTFWHTGPEVNPNFRVGKLGEYYMSFSGKADYTGQFDSVGIPLLDYHGAVGLQYNPIAIAQYGLGNFNYYCRTGDDQRREKFISAADWLVKNLEQNPAGLWVWNHHFDWEYRSLLKAPWYSALAQGQGLSILVRAYQDTDNRQYLDSAQLAFESFLKKLDEGGVSYLDENGFVWFEEYIVLPLPPTHVLNGFIWASWGIYDYYLATGDPQAKKLFDEVIRTLESNLRDFDNGFWSLYEQSGTRLKMIASPFYHRLHIVQLHVMFLLSGREIFQHYKTCWENYLQKPGNRAYAMGYKGIFKFFYY